MKKGFKILIIIFLFIIFIASGCVGYYILKNTKKEKLTVNTDTVGLSNINISWNSIKDANEYNVIICNDLTNDEINNIYNNYSSTEKCITNTTEKSKFKFEDLKINKMYYIFVNTKKNNKVLSSSIKRVKTDDIEIEKISNLKISDISDTSSNITWDEYKVEIDNTNVSKVSYVININDEEIETDKNTYKLEKLSPLTKYTITISAKLIINEDEFVSEQEEDTFITLGSKITNLKTTSNTNSISLTWNKYNTENEVLYDVYSSSSKNGDYTLASGDIKDPKYTLSSLSAGTTKYFYVIAKIKLDEEYISSIKSDVVSGTTKNNTTNNNNSNSNSNANNNNTGGTNNSGELTNAQKDAEARKIARQIASRVTGSTDLERIQSAAYEVALYANKAVYTNDDKDYRLPYGVFIKGVYTCAGTARALGMVLEEMGYSWKHVNENQWSHQWVELTVNGQKMWADAFPTLLWYGKTGMAGFGDYPYA